MKLKRTMEKLLCDIKREILLFVFMVLLIVLSCLNPSAIKNYPYFVDWSTIAILTGLMVITAGLRKSRYFDILAARILNRLRTERSLALFFVMFSAAISTFLTNDIALFIVVPLTLSVQKFIKNDISRLIIFEAMAVNVGSALTPIGNPQNIFLWRQWGIPFLKFVLLLIPLVGIQLIILVGFIFAVFPAKTIKTASGSIEEGYDMKLLMFSAVMLVLYILSAEFKVVIWLLPVVLLMYLMLFENVLREVDWLFLLLFVLIFIDFSALADTPSISDVLVAKADLSMPRNVYVASALLSQIMSNVPAAVFVSRLSHDWLAITYGVNIGGNGLIIGSLANIIAWRICDSDSGILLKFHKYSIPFFLLTGAIILAMFVYLF